jgi:cell division protein FtsW (lipid II flippase)
VRDQDTDDRFAVAALELAGGCVVVVVAALGAVAILAPFEQGARLLTMAVAAGVLAAAVTDWRTCVAVTVVAVLVFVGFLAHRYGDLAGGSGWSGSVMIAFAALLGRGRRWMRGVPVSGAGVAVRRSR